MFAIRGIALGVQRRSFATRISFRESDKTIDFVKRTLERIYGQEKANEMLNFELYNNMKRINPYFPLQSFEDFANKRFPHIDCHESFPKKIIESYKGYLQDKVPFFMPGA